MIGLFVIPTCKNCAGGPSIRLGDWQTLLLGRHHAVRRSHQERLRANEQRGLTPLTCPAMTVLSLLPCSPLKSINNCISETGYGFNSSQI